MLKRHKAPTMNRIEIYGASDDLIEIRIDGKDVDELNVYEDGPYMGSLRLVAKSDPESACLVHVIYDGCWSFAVGRTDEGKPLPTWAFSVEPEHDYSTRLVIDTGGELVVITKLGVEK
jgi:hypothetical protein